jgi:hypothetical protein
MSWRHEFGAAALTALEKLFHEMEIYDTKDRADYVQWQLGDDETDKIRPFYYKEYEDGKKPVVCPLLILKNTKA